MIAENAGECTPADVSIRSLSPSCGRLGIVGIGDINSGFNPMGICGSDIVNSGGEMTAQIIPFDRKLDAAWAEYIDAKARAETSGKMRDGIAAGRAWARWLDLFARQA